MKKIKILVCIMCLCLFVPALTACGDPVDQTIEGVSYKYEYGRYWVAGASGENITVKSEVKDVKVAGILNGAFKDNTTVKSVSFDAMDSGLTFVIGENAFKDSKVEKLLHLPAKSSVNINSFILMPNIKEISVRGEAEEGIYAKNNILYLSYSGSEYIVKAPTDITAMPAGWADEIDEIYKGAFDYCALNSIEFPATIDSVAENAIMKPKNLEEIVFYSSATRMTKNALDTSVIHRGFKIYVNATNDSQMSTYLNYGPDIVKSEASGYPMLVHPVAQRGHDCSKIHGGGSGSGITASYAGYTYSIEGEMVSVMVGIVQITRSIPYMAIVK